MAACIRGLEDVVPVIAAMSSLATKGRNISGRGWKRINQPRASTFMRSKDLGGSGSSVSWTERQSQKRKREDIKQLESDLKEEKRKTKIEARKRREERAAVKAANEMKGTTMQMLSKTHKLKNMNKKQLRLIKKTAINAQTGELELVSPWKK